MDQQIAQVLAVVQIADHGTMHQTATHRFVDQVHEVPGPVDAQRVPEVFLQLVEKGVELCRAVHMRTIPPATASYHLVAG